MSRIHEALKKAAQDRATQSPTAVTADLVDGAAEINRHIEPTRQFDAAERFAQRRYEPRFKDAGVLTYEELIKRCSHPKWTLDARNSVFVGCGQRQSRSRAISNSAIPLYQIAGTQRFEEAVDHQQYPGGRKDLCGRQPGAVHCSPTGPPRVVD